MEEKEVTLRELVDLQRQTLELLRQSLELLQRVATPPFWIRPFETQTIPSSPNTVPYIQPRPYEQQPTIAPSWPPVKPTIFCSGLTAQGRTGMLVENNEAPCSRE